jgi:signal recognition particle receptor subunit beta
MALFNYATKEITIKIVYYGPGLSGKTTNLQYLHSVLDPETKGKLLSLATEADRTLFFDFLPVELGKIRDFSIRFQLYTVPGQVRYNATRKLVLRGADAIVFVADSQRDMREQNTESLHNMYENLFSNNINPEEIPIILQYNKRDLPNILSIDELNSDLNKNGTYEYTESTAIDGIGVENTFQHITKLVFKGISEKHRVTVEPAEELRDTVLEEKQPHVEPAEELSETVVMKEPYEEEFIEQLTSEDIFSSPSPEKSETSTPEAIMYGTVPEDEPLYEPAIEEKPVQEESVPIVLEEKLSSIEEVLKETKESLRKHEENVAKIINSNADSSQLLIDMKLDVAKLQNEIRDLIKEQKDIYVLLRDVQHVFENIKVKKSWFKLS